MRTYLPIPLVVSILFVGAAFCAAETIDTFIMEESPLWISGLHVGPEGDIWFTQTRPARLMRVSDNGIECVYDSGTIPWEYDITITPDGVIWLGPFRYIYSADARLYESDIELPEETQWFGLSGPGIVDADCRMFVTGIGGSILDPTYRSCQIFEVGPGIAPDLRYGQYYGGLDSILVVSARECWACGTWKGGGSGLCRINLEAGTLDGWYSGLNGGPSAKDSRGLLWLILGPSVETFDGSSLSVFAEGDEEGLWYQEPVLAADGAVWSVEADDDWSHATTYFGIARFMDGQKRTFTVDDGLLSNWCESPVIDYDGRLWVVNWGIASPYRVGLSRISDGGWPPMRLMLHRLETPEGAIAVEAQVINNGPVVGVDVYVALEMNGQLLFWPNWQPAPSPVQVNLRPGHNQTATIISAPRSSIPPGTYTFWGCMTGRNTQKLIGPLDRKFESLTIQID